MRCFSLSEHNQQGHIRSEDSLRTQSRIEHVQSHLIAFRRARYGHQSLIAVVLWLIDLDYAPTKLPDLVDLRTSLSNNGTDHIVWNEDLLRQRLTGYHSLHWLRRRPSVPRISSVTVSLLGLMRPSTGVAAMWRPAIVYWSLRLLLRWLTVKIWYTIGIRRSALSLIVVALVVVRMAVLSPRRLRHVRDNLHTPRHNASWSTTACSIR